MWNDLIEALRAQLANQVVAGAPPEVPVPQVASTSLPAIDAEPRMQVPGLTSALRLPSPRVTQGDRVVATVHFAADQGVACAVPTMLALLWCSETQ